MTKVLLKMYGLYYAKYLKYCLYFVEYWIYWLLASVKKPFCRFIKLKFDKLNNCKKTLTVVISLCIEPMSYD